MEVSAFGDHGRADEARRRAGGYAGLVPPMRYGLAPVVAPAGGGDEAPPDEPRTPRLPTLPVRDDDGESITITPASTATPAPSASPTPAATPTANPAGAGSVAATAEPVPVHPYTGLPTEPTGEVTETPPWTRRHPTRAGRRVRILFWAVVIVAVAVAVLLGFSVYLPDSDAALVPDDDAGAAAAEVDGIRPAVASLEDEIATSEPSGPTTTGPVRSFAFEVDDAFGFAAVVSVDVETGDYVARLSSGAEVRRVDGLHVGRSEGGTWVPLSPDAASSVPPAMVDGPLTTGDVLPEWLASLVTDERSLPEGGLEYVVDGDGPDTVDPAVWRRWLAGWGVLPGDGETPDGPVVITIAADADGLVTTASIVAPEIGGAISYTLQATSPDSITVAQPLDAED